MTGEPVEGLRINDPGLRALISDLTSPATAAERAGLDADLTAFRAVCRSGPLPPEEAGAQPRRRRRLGSAALATAATVLVLGGGFAAAAYAAVLPAPLQRVAHQILGFAGVPGSQVRTPGGSHQLTGPGVHGGAGKGHGGIAGRPTGSPAPSAPGSASPASPSPTPSLTPRHSQSPTPQPTSPTAAPSPSPSRSAAQVIVTLDVAPGPGKATADLLGSAPLARQGDTVELQDWSGSQWKVLRSHRLGKNEQVTFSVALRRIAVTYRVVLLATASHGQAVSNQVVVPARPHKGNGKGGRG
jgi:hypothetical protein